MAKCKVCGRWLGVGVSEHGAECPGPPAPPDELDKLAAKLAPVILKAGTRAGIAAALTFIAIGVVLFILRAVLMAVIS